MIRFIILIGIMAQIFISNRSRKNGALVGYGITTIILIWGLQAYSTGYIMTMFSIPLSFGAFIIACLIWYGFDTYEYQQAHKNEKATAFLTAASNGQLDVVEKLIAEGIDINTKSITGDTALSLAANGGHVDTVNCLIGHNADVNIQNANGTSALIFAYQKGYQQIAELLITNGADVNAVNHKGESALDLSRQSGSQEIADIPVDGGAQ